MGRMRPLLVIAALVLSGSAATSALPHGDPPGTYRIRNGDTLSGIAAKLHVEVDALVQANGLHDPNRIAANALLRLPSAPRAAAPKLTSAVAPVVAPLPSTVVVVQPAVRTHRIGRGEAAAGVAGALGTDVGTLLRMNALRSASSIRPGMIVQAPGPAWLCPVQGRTSFIDSWGAARAGGRRHLGVDIMSPRGTPVVASVAGTLELRSGTVGGNAYYLHGDDGNTYYGAHLDAVTARPGPIVRGGQIGIVGDTGDAKGTGTHLHFELHPGGGPAVNPWYTVRQWC